MARLVELRRNSGSGARGALKFFLTSLTCFWALSSIGAAEIKGPFETPPTLRASQILPPQLLKGPYHTVNEVVQNDGYLNRYVIESKFGEFEGVMTAKLRKRIDEINAMVVMEKIKGTEVFKDSVIEAGGDVVHGLKNLVTSPVDTVSGAVSGIGAIFNRAGEVLFRSKKSKYEDSRFEALIGFSKTKREYAHNFGIDAYSTNQVLQDRLDEIAWAGYVGGLTVAGAMSMVGGVAGIITSASGISRVLNDVVAQTPPPDLRQRNRKSLREMGVDKDIAALYIDNDIFTPRQQTAFVMALERLKGVKNKQAFVRFGILTKNQDIAFFRQRMAEMFAAYHNKVAKIDRFQPIDDDSPVKGIDIAVTQTGKAVMVVPLDYLVWTKLVAHVFAEIDETASAIPGVKGKEFWITGTLTPLANQQIQKFGWKVFDKIEKRLDLPRW